MPHESGSHQRTVAKASVVPTVTRISAPAGGRSRPWSCAPEVDRSAMTTDRLPWSAQADAAKTTGSRDMLRRPAKPSVLFPNLGISILRRCRTPDPFTASALIACGKTRLITLEGSGWDQSITGLSINARRNPPAPLRTERADRRSAPSAAQGRLHRGPRPGRQARPACWMRGAATSRRRS